MRHRKSGIKLNRTASHRKAMFRNMVTSLFKHDRIQTTDAKAKELRRWADHIITLAKRGDLHARRQAMAIIQEKKIVHKLFEEAGERFGAISGGYTRIVKVGRRPGDAAPVSMIELIARAEGGKKPKKKAKAVPSPESKEDKKEATEDLPAAQVEKQEETTEAKAAAEPVEDQEPAEATETGEEGAENKTPE